MLRLAVRLLGLDLFSLEVSTDEPADDAARDLSGGTVCSTPVGFVARFGLPDGAVRPEFE